LPHNGWFLFAATQEKPVAAEEVPLRTERCSRWSVGKSASQGTITGARLSITFPLLRSLTMALVTIRPTAIDLKIADAIAAHTEPPAEDLAEGLTWGADEHVLIGLTAAWWLYARHQTRDQRNAADHVLLATLVASALPHVLKTVFDQQRPDRLTVRGHWRGVPFSGNRFDAFPSGHAVHVGALASAASVLSRRRRHTVWAIGAGLVATRIVLLAHWTSDVIAGLAIGAVTERLLRRLTGYGRGQSDKRPS
jgi:membrane-associated phospholipid phosphatase